MRYVIPAKAGIQGELHEGYPAGMDSRLRGNDKAVYFSLARSSVGMHTAQSRAARQESRPPRSFSSCSLSLWERVRVREPGLGYRLSAYATIFLTAVTISPICGSVSFGKSGRDRIRSDAQLASGNCSGVYPNRSR